MEIGVSNSFDLSTEVQVLYDIHRIDSVKLRTKAQVGSLARQGSC
jgi:hypothetical protein